MPTTRHASAGILADANAAKREEIVALLTRAYWMEMETVMSYLANSAHLDGIRAEEIAEALAADVDRGARPRQAVRRAHQGPLRHAARLDGLRGRADLPAAARGPDRRRRPSSSGVIEAEAGAIEHYTRIIEACDGVDWATQDMVIDILRDEENHLRTFERYLTEYE